MKKRWKKLAMGEIARAAENDEVEWVDFYDARCHRRLSVKKFCLKGHSAAP
jgi:hypothetical protein